MAFEDLYPGGRIPVLAPVTWSSDGWPSVTLVNKAWGNSYPYPNCAAAAAVPIPSTIRWVDLHSWLGCSFGCPRAIFLYAHASESRGERPGSQAGVADFYCQR